MRSLALATALLLAPALARAQQHTYQMSGCDYAYADVFGAGPRLCAAGLVTVLATDPTRPDGEQVVTFDHLVFQGFTGFLVGRFDSDAVHALSLAPGIGQDGGVSVCNYTVCRGTVSGAVSGIDGMVSGPYAPQFGTLTVRYVADSVPTGGARVGSYGAVSTFALAVVPEPVTFALVAGGLAVLGAAGTRRRRAS